jgi:hypothetical protein
MNQFLVVRGVTFVALMLLGLAGLPSFAGAQGQADAHVPVVGHPVASGVSPTLRSLAAQQGASELVDAGLVRKIPKYRAPKAPTDKITQGPRASTPDAIVQGEALAAADMPAPLSGFDGLSNADNSAVFGFTVLPPDTNGDVGPAHYVQVVNILIKVFDKATGAALLGPVKMSSLFTSLGGVCATTDDGDPIVLYDPLADRWLVSQFALPNPFHQCIAISQTGDPTGAYFVYDFVMPNNFINDYPKFGVWPDAYYMSDNQFNSTGTASFGSGAFAFDRTKMLVGDPTATFVYFDLHAMDPNIFGVLPVDGNAGLLRVLHRQRVRRSAG